MKNLLKYAYISIINCCTYILNISSIFWYFFYSIFIMYFSSFSQSAFLRLASIFSFNQQQQTHFPALSPQQQQLNQLAQHSLILSLSLSPTVYTTISYRMLARWNWFSASQRTAIWTNVAIKTVHGQRHERASAQVQSEAVKREGEGNRTRERDRAENNSNTFLEASSQSLESFIPFRGNEAKIFYDCRQRVRERERECDRDSDEDRVVASSST